MKRDYTDGVKEDVIYFIGKEVEHTPAYGMKTLFVNGVQPVEDIALNLQGCEHIFFGANHSFNPQSYKEHKAWEQVIRASLSDKRGRALFIGTPKGRNWFYDTFKLGESEDDPDWKSWHFTTADNPLIDQKEIESAKKTLSTFAFKQEYMASPKARFFGYTFVSMSMTSHQKKRICY